MIAAAYDINPARWGAVSRETGAASPPTPDAASAGGIAGFLRSLDDYLSGRVDEEPKALPEDSERLMWLDEVYSLVHKQMPDDAIDVLFEHIDTLLSAGDFERCDDVLRTIDTTRLDVNLNVAVLSATKRAAAALSERERLIRRVQARLMEQDADRAKRLLAALR